MVEVSAPMIRGQRKVTNFFVIMPKKFNQLRMTLGTLKLCG